MISHAPPDLHALHDDRLAVALATGAAAVLNRIRTSAEVGLVEGGEPGLRRAGDAGAQAWLAAAIARARPLDAVLSEEAPDDGRRLAADRVWIIDPLDGTREFAERGPDGRWRDDFAVHVALWHRDAGVVEAAVALPARSRMWSSASPVVPDDAAAHDVLEGRRPLRIAASRTRPPAVVQRLATRDDVAVEPMGSTGVKVVSVLEGTVDAYVHAGGQHEWDSAAPVAIARACGFTATRLDGSPIAYNQADPWSPDIVVCHPALGVRLRELLAWAGVEMRTGVGS